MDHRLPNQQSASKMKKFFQFTVVVHILITLQIVGMDSYYSKGGNVIPEWLKYMEILLFPISNIFSNSISPLTIIFFLCNSLAYGLLAMLLVALYARVRHSSV